MGATGSDVQFLLGYVRAGKLCFVYFWIDPVLVLIVKVATSGASSMTDIGEIQIF